MVPAFSPGCHFMASFRYACTAPAKYRSNSRHSLKIWPYVVLPNRGKAYAKKGVVQSPGANLFQCRVIGVLRNSQNFVVVLPHCRLVKFVVEARETITVDNIGSKTQLQSTSFGRCSTYYLQCRASFSYAEVHHVSTFSFTPSPELVNRKLTATTTGVFQAGHKTKAALHSVLYTKELS